MPPQIIGQYSYNGGEVSPRLKGRTDQALYAVSAEEMLAYVPTLQGPAVADMGTRFVEVAAGPFRGIPFEYNPTQGYLIEASASKFRFFTNDARIETSPGVAYEVATPYTFTQLATIDFAQSFDVLYLVGAGLAPRTLTRTAATSFSLGIFETSNGPIGDGNSDQTITVGVSATTGAIQLLASAAIFVATDVGSLFEQEAADTGDIPAWEPGIARAVNDKCTWDGKVYQATAGTRTGTVAPIHDQGEEYDGSVTGTDINAKGPYGVKWKFLYGRIGLARITGFTSTSIVTASVIKRFADGLVTKGSWRWAFGAFSNTRGWPTAVALWEECLVLFKGSTGYASVVGDLANFERRDSSGDFQRDLAGSFTLPSTAEIRWGRADRMLVIGTDRAEFTVERIVTQGAGAGPPIFQIKLQGTSGVSTVPPVQVAGRILYLQRAQRKLLEMAYAFASDRYTAPDLARLAGHIAARGIVATAHAQEPAQILWMVLADGTMAGMTYDPDQQVMGWFRRELGGGLKARTAARITDPAGTRDQLWLGVETVSGAWWVLRKEKPWEIGDARLTANLTDAALSYSGAAISAGTGAAHLVGMTVDVLADGKPHPRVVIGAGGSWTLTYAAADITLGLPFAARFRPLPIAGGDGSIQAKVKRVNEVTLRLLESAGLSVSVQGQAGQLIDTVAGSDVMDGAASLYSGDARVSSLGAFDRDGQILIERVQPLPSTIAAHFHRVEVAE